MKICAARYSRSTLIMSVIFCISFLILNLVKDKKEVSQNLTTYFKIC